MLPTADELSSRSLTKIRLLDSEDFSQFRHICFIDSTVESQTQFSACISSDTYPVIYDFSSDRTSLKTALLQQFTDIERMSFVFHGPPQDQCCVTPKLFLNNQPFFECLECSCSASGSNQAFLQDLFTSLHVQHVHFLACNLMQHQEWRDFFASFQNVVVVGS